MAELTYKAPRVFEPHAEEKRYQELISRFGRKKKLHREFELQILVALSHFPDLEDIAIDFETVWEADHTLYARPAITDLLQNARERRYIISISDYMPETKQPVLLKNLDFSVQIGQLGHELAHIMDYIHKSSLQLVQDGLFYFMPEYRRNMEKSTDALAVKHGLGHQILGYSLLVEKLKDVYPHEPYYKDFGNYYMTSNEVIALMNELELYRDEMI